jgi:ADP-ribose pyrophosphatase YjhB (NUDIX family)
MHKLATAEAARLRFGRVRRALALSLHRLLHAYWRVARGLTLGVRAVVLDGEGRVFLVKHSYAAGWHLPGGGVEAGETAAEALARELFEEGRIALLAPPVLHAIYFNTGASRRDHVLVYVVRDFHQHGEPVPGREIVAHGFFPPRALPADTTPATRACLAEVIDAAPVRARW